MIIRWRRILGLLFLVALVWIVGVNWNRFAEALGSIDLTVVELGHRQGDPAQPLTLLIWALLLLLAGVLIGKVIWGPRRNR